MPRHCEAAGCDTVSSMGYSLHSFPKGKTKRRKCRSAVKRQKCKKLTGTALCQALFCLKRKTVL